MAKWVFVIHSVFNPYMCVKRNIRKMSNFEGLDSKRP